MRRYLILTPLDVPRQTNNREHHLLRHLGPRFDEVVVVYRRKCTERGWRAVLRDALWPSVRIRQRGRVRYVEVNPLFNHRQGLAMDVSGSYDDGTWAAWRHARGRFACCSAFAPWGNAPAWLLKRLGRIEVWCYADRDYEPGFISTPLRRAVAGRLQLALLRRADLRTATGYRLARLLEDRIARKVHVVTNGVDVRRFPNPDRDLRAPILAYTGNVTFWSGLEAVIQGLPDLIGEHPELRLWVIGEGLEGYRRRLEDQAKSLGMWDRVHFFGRVENERVPELLARCHVGLATFQPVSFRALAFPLKVLEYFATGLPVLATSGTETEDLVERHGCGLAVPFESAAVREGARRLLADEGEWRRLSRRAREAAEAYDWARLMEVEYELLTGAARRPAGEGR
jgi:glycosyltransferase involved in cell wall biosynthesis